MNFSPISSEILETSSKYIILDHKLAITKQSYLQIFEFSRSFRSRAKTLLLKRHPRERRFNFKFDLKRHSRERRFNFKFDLKRHSRERRFHFNFDLNFKFDLKRHSRDEDLILNLI